MIVRTILESQTLKSRMSSATTGITELAFKNGVNILVGENGSGKSTLLEAIYSEMRKSGTGGLALIYDPTSKPVYYSSEKSTSAHLMNSSKESSPLSSNSRSHGEALYADLISLHTIGDKTVVLLDEPEIGLSIDKLGDVCKLIQDKVKDGNIQFIIVSHHPLVWTISNANFVPVNGDKTYVKTQARQYIRRLNKLI